MLYQCRECMSEYPLNTLEYKCKCGGHFNLKFNKSGYKPDLYKDVSNLSLWDYECVLPFNKEESRDITMMEGLTPLIPLEEDLYAKAEYYMPTLSFKDRGGVMLVLLAKKIGLSEIAIDSSGNAATSVTAYSTRAGVRCHVFVPEKTSTNKLKQIQAHGGIVHTVWGNREDTSLAVKEFITLNNIFYASHIYNPVFYHGTKTYFYEVFEQLGFRFPDIFIIPIGNGTLIFGAELAFLELKEAGYIQKYPKIIGVQAKNCAPLISEDPVSIKETIAEGIAIPNPPRKKEILEIVNSTGGYIIGVDEDEILSAKDGLAKKGLYVEDTSAVNYCAYLKIKENLTPSESVVIPLCGSGLKSNWQINTNGLK